MSGRRHLICSGSGSHPCRQESGTGRHPFSIRLFRYNSRFRRFDPEIKGARALSDNSFYELV
jgi:hypothetical protein